MSSSRSSCLQNVGSAAAPDRTRPFNLSFPDECSGADCCGMSSVTAINKKFIKKFYLELLTDSRPSHRDSRTSEWPQYLSA